MLLWLATLEVLLKEESAEVAIRSDAGADLNLSVLGLPQP